MKLLLLLLLLSTPALSIERYDRSLYGVWSDLDNNCLTTRNEVLKKYGKVIVWKNKCTIVDGVWKDAYTDTIIKGNKTIDIDHVIPLEYAHYHGLKYNQRKLFGNDMDNLLPTTASLNRSKGSKSIYAWHPQPPYFCNYARIWNSISLKYQLTLDQNDRQAIKEGMSTCK